MIYFAIFMSGCIKKKKKMIKLTVRENVMDQLLTIQSCLRDHILLNIDSLND